MENEAKHLGIEGNIESSTSDVFQDNFYDVVKGYLSEKLEWSDVDETKQLYDEFQAHEISTVTLVNLQLP